MAENIAARAITDPGTKKEREEGKRLWGRRMRESLQDSARAVVRNPKSITSAEGLKVLNLVRSVATQPPHGVLDLVRSFQPAVALDQEFEGIVTQVDDRFVDVEFEEGRRRFELKSLKVDRPLRVGDVVQVRCQLQVMPPPRPMSAEEIDAWEADYQWARDPRLKAMREGP